MNERAALPGAPITGTARLRSGLQTGDARMNDDFDLERFVAAQEPIYEQALAELRGGRKRSHWMWFIFPQLAELGRSSTARFYGMGSAAEASGYLGHSVLGPRLVECSRALLAHRGARPDEIMGSIDAMKLRSSMTLFEVVADEPEPFADVLDAFYPDRDQETLRLLRA